MRVQLSSSELLRAATVGVLRRISSIQAGHANAHGFDGQEAWMIDIEGAAAECAVAKLLGVYWDASVKRFSGSPHGDVGPLEVRWTPRADRCLIVRDRDPADRRFVLVTGEYGTYDVHGEILGRDARRDEWLRAPNGRPAAWFVPRSALRPLEEAA